ncbi:Methyltransferase domain-containing protein [Proteiniborus ethanoligenes]|uniref:Methyltransferase domain-containing protein n=1 Tax=Proteiniborus ethanoligenes TaxID=415015 RepID=A0A1H3QWT4_9FIRM|nr:Methyltransferase domain-containing protein [Proteiniborus ethanoligenes]
MINNKEEWENYKDNSSTFAHIIGKTGVSLVGFYEELSKYYDIIFPATVDKIQFIEKVADKGKYILDIACGTGNYAIELTKRGYILDGIDLDNTMIEAGNNKAMNEAVDINFVHGDMKNVNDIFSSRKYDLVYCIGNSLVHLDNEKEVQQLINHISNITNNKGKLLIQIINYDRILDFNIDHLPTISRKEAGVEFIRNYAYDEKSGKIFFNTVINVSNETGMHKYENSVQLLPLRTKTLVNMVKNAEYERVEVFGGFNEEEHSVNSFATVLVAEK